MAAPPPSSPAATVVSLDDSVSRAAFLDKLAEVTPSLVPFVRAFYTRQSVYLWWDGAGACHRILQGDGCEQGDALAPALFALAQHAALVAASQQLRPGEFLAAFLDDLYIVTVPNRARAALEAVSSAVEELAGVAANLGKTRVYNRAGGSFRSAALRRGVATNRCPSVGLLPSARPGVRCRVREGAPGAGARLAGGAATAA